MSNDQTKQPWEQQPDESAKAYEAAKIYFEMGASRSLEAVGQKLGKSRGLMLRWSAKNHWVERARAYDEARTKAQHAIVMNTLPPDVMERWRAEQLRMPDLVKGLNDKAAAMLETKLFTTEITQKLESIGQDWDGTPMRVYRETVVLKPAGWNFGATARMIQVSNQLLQQAVGQANSGTTSDTRLAHPTGHDEKGDEG